MKKQYPILIILGLVILGLSPSLKNEYGLDDYLYLEQLHDVYDLVDIPNVWNKQFAIVDYRPVSSTVFALEKVFFDGFDSTISHAINLFLYLLCVLFFYLFVKKIHPSRYLAIIATTIFALLPLHTSLVGNVKNRDGLLSFLMGITAYYLILKIPKEKKAYKIILYVASTFILFYLAIFAKLDAIMFVVGIPLLFILNLRFEFDFKQLEVPLKNILRVAIVAAIFYRITFATFGFWTEKKNKIVADLPLEERTDPLIFTENPIIAYDGIGYKAAYTVQTVFEYVKLMFSPKGHYFYYGYDTLEVLPWNSPIIWLKAIFLILLIASAVYSFRKHPVYTFGVLFMFASMTYCANFVQPIAGIIADRYIFIASAGGSIAIAYLIYQIYEKLQASSKLQINREQFTWGLVLALSILYIPFNFVRAKQWKNLYTIIEADLPKLKDKSYEANRIAMKTYIEDAFNIEHTPTRTDFFHKGIDYAQNALQIYSENYLPYEGIALAYFGLGDLPQAKMHALNSAKKFGVDQIETTYRILHEVYVAENNIDSTLWTLAKLNQVVPHNDELILKFAETSYRAGQIEEATQFCDSILVQNPKQIGAIQAKAYIHFYNQDSLQGATDAEQAFKLGLRDEMLLIATTEYWIAHDSLRAEKILQYQ